MFKRFALVLSLVAALTIAFAGPALAVTFQAFESGTLECYPGSTTAKTVILAKGDHKHKVGTLSSPPIDFPDDGQWYQSQVSWAGVYVAGYTLYNQSGRSYSTTSSYGICT